MAGRRSTATVIPDETPQESAVACEEIQLPFVEVVMRCPMCNLRMTPITKSNGTQFFHTAAPVSGTNSHACPNSNKSFLTLPPEVHPASV